MAYWLFKTEPTSYSFADLMAEPDRTTGWDGVRNYQARNLLRDHVQVGDGVLFYHSSADPPCIAGIAEVVRAAHPDPTAFDRQAGHYDPKSDPSNPTWYQVSIKGVRAIDPPLGPSVPEDGCRTGRHGAVAQGEPAIGTARDRERVEDDRLTGQIKEKPLIPFRGLTTGLWNPDSEIRKAPMSQIEHFAIYADDPTALKDFYVGTFGLHVIFESGGDPPAYFLADDHGMAIEVLERPPGNSGVRSALGLSSGVVG